jgi:hypothetical protein
MTSKTAASRSYGITRETDIAGSSGVKASALEARKRDCIMIPLFSFIGDLRTWLHVDDRVPVAMYFMHPTKDASTKSQILQVAPHVADPVFCDRTTMDLLSQSPILARRRGQAQNE